MLLLFPPVNCARLSVRLFVHQMDNNASIMRYWFEEPYEAFIGVSDLYDKHIHVSPERRFIVESDGARSGWWNWWKSIMYTAALRIPIIIAPSHQGHGFCVPLPSGYGLCVSVLNLYKLYLIVDVRKQKADHIYKARFFIPSQLIDRVFSQGRNTAASVCVFFSRNI